jgi:hypothetical protein
MMRLRNTGSNAVKTTAHLSSHIKNIFFENPVEIWAKIVKRTLGRSIDVKLHFDIYTC